MFLQQTGYYQQPAAARSYWVAVLFTGLIPFTAAPAAAGNEIVVKSNLNYDLLRQDKNRQIRIVNSPGGVGSAALALSRIKRLVIDGTCNSACAWAFVSNPSACYTKKASFGFHGAHDPGTGKRLPKATEYWLSRTRLALRSRLDVLRSTSRVVRISARDMRQYYPGQECDPYSKSVKVAATQNRMSTSHSMTTLLGRSQDPAIDLSTSAYAIALLNHPFKVASADELVGLVSANRFMMEMRAQNTHVSLLSPVQPMEAIQALDASVPYKAWDHDKLKPRLAGSVYDFSVVAPDLYRPKPLPDHPRERPNHAYAERRFGETTRHAAGGICLMLTGAGLLMLRGSRRNKKENGESDVLMVTHVHLTASSADSHFQVP